MAREGERHRKREAGLGKNIAPRTEVPFPHKQFLLERRKPNTLHLFFHVRRSSCGHWRQFLPNRLLPALWLGGKQPFGEDANPPSKGSERCLSVVNGMPKMSAPQLPGSGSGELSQAPRATAGRSLGLALHQLLPCGATSVHMW